MKSAEPLVVQLARGHLQGQVGLRQLLECVETTVQKLEEHRGLVRTQSRDPRLAPELSAVEQCFDDYLSILRGQSYAGMVEHLPDRVEHLARALAQLDQTRWVLQGPTTLAGLNEILWLAREQQWQRLEQRLEQERHFWSGYPARQPEALRPLALEFARVYLEWLKSFPGSDQVEGWSERGAQLGSEHAAWDLVPILRASQEGPTTFPTFNAVVHAISSRSRGELGPEAVDLCLDQLQQACQLVQPAEEEEAREFGELLEDLSKLLPHLSRWNAAPRAEALPPLLKLLNELGEEFADFSSLLTAPSRPD
jgi:hypothetical protein